MAPEKSPSRARTWKPQADGTPVGGKPLATRRRKIFTILAVMLALLGAIGAWLLLVSPFHPPRFLTISLTRYNNFPVNPFARADSEALYQDFPEDRTETPDNQSKVQVLDSLDHFGQAGGKAVVVHLCAFARVDRGTGKLCLIPGDARREDPKTWIPMDRVLEPLRSCRAKHKLLLLDLHRPPADPLHDLQDDDLAGSFQAVFQAGDNNGLQVLLACSPGQTSQVSPELGMSVFAYYLNQGLGGQAEGYRGEGKRSGRVALEELYAFVRDRVDRWAIRNRGVRQTPVLLGKGSDFDLAAVAEKKHKSPEPSRLAAYPPRLRQGWQQRDDWVKGEVFQAAPQLVRQVEALLMAQEQEWRGGGDPQDIVKRLRAQLGAYSVKTEEAAPPKEKKKEGEAKEKKADKGDKKADKKKPEPKKEAKPPTEVAPPLERAGSLGGEAAEELGELPHPRLPSLFPLLRKGLTPGAETARKELLGLLTGVDASTKPDQLEKDKAAFLKKVKDVPADDLAAAMLQLCLDDACTNRLHFQVLVDLLKKFQDRPRFVEQVYFQRLADLEDKYPQWPLEEVRVLFQVVQEAARARAVRPREFPWVRHLFVAAEKNRREAEQLFFAGKKANLPRARDLFGEALQEFKDINRDRTVVREAHEAADEAFHLLPAYVPYLVAQYPQEGAEELQRSWFNAVGEADALAARLAQEPTADKPPAPDPFADQLSQLAAGTRNLRKYLDDLRQPFQAVDPAKILNPGPGGQEAIIRGAFRALNQTRAVLATPCPSAPEREALLRTRLALARELNKGTLELDRQDQAGNHPTRVPDNLLAGRPRSPGGEPAFRGRLALALLRLAGADPEELKKLEQALEAAQKKGTAAGWNALTQDFRRAWDNRQKLLAGADLIRADRLNRAWYLPAGERVAGNPTLQRRRREARDYWNWLGDFYDQESQALAGLPAYQELFLDVSRICKNS